MIEFWNTFDFDATAEDAAIFRRFPALTLISGCFFKGYGPKLLWTFWYPFLSWVVLNGIPFVTFTTFELIFAIVVNGIFDSFFRSVELLLFGLLYVKLADPESDGLLPLWLDACSFHACLELNGLCGVEGLLPLAVFWCSSWE